jgi:hypothetical protein
VIDEHARQLVADRPIDDQRGHRGVDAARQRAEHLGVADLLADPTDLLVHDVRRCPVGEQAAAVVEEPLHHGLASRRMRHLRMELHREQAALAILHGGDGDRGGPRGDAEAVGSAHDGVAV